MLRVAILFIDTNQNWYDVTAKIIWNTISKTGYLWMGCIGSKFINGSCFQVPPSLKRGVRCLHGYWMACGQLQNFSNSPPPPNQQVLLDLHSIHHKYQNIVRNSWSKPNLSTPKLLPKLPKLGILKKNCQISKIPKPKCVSGHTEQLWFYTDKTQD